jgi:hypothetical protein
MRVDKNCWIDLRSFEFKGICQYTLVDLVGYGTVARGQSGSKTYTKFLADHRRYTFYDRLFDI